MTDTFDWDDNLFTWDSLISPWDGGDVLYVNLNVNINRRKGLFDPDDRPKKGLYTKNKWL